VATTVVGYFGGAALFVLFGCFPQEIIASSVNAAPATYILFILISLKPVLPYTSTACKHGKDMPLLQAEGRYSKKRYFTYGLNKPFHNKSFHPGITFSPGAKLGKKIQKSGFRPDHGRANVKSVHADASSVRAGQAHIHSERNTTLDESKQSQAADRGNS
jgi:hypothetical protein